MDSGFSYELRKDGSVAVRRDGKPVRTIGGAAARRLAERLEAAADDNARQLVLAKATGNYRRGNERAR